MEDDDLNAMKQAAINSVKAKMSDDDDDDEAELAELKQAALLSKRKGVAGAEFVPARVDTPPISTGLMPVAGSTWLPTRMPVAPHAPTMTSFSQLACHQQIYNPPPASNVLNTQHDIQIAGQIQNFLIVPQQSEFRPTAVQSFPILQPQQQQPSEVRLAGPPNYMLPPPSSQPYLSCTDRRLPQVVNLLPQDDIRFRPALPPQPSSAVGMPHALSFSTEPQIDGRVGSGHSFLTGLPQNDGRLAPSQNYSTHALPSDARVAPIHNFSFGPPPPEVRTLSVQNFPTHGPQNDVRVLPSGHNCIPRPLTHDIGVMHGGSNSLIRQPNDGRLPVQNFVTQQTINDGRIGQNPNFQNSVPMPMNDGLIGRSFSNHPPPGDGRMPGGQHFHMRLPPCDNRMPPPQNVPLYSQPMSHYNYPPRPLLQGGGYFQSSEPQNNMDRSSVLYTSSGQPAGAIPELLPAANRSNLIVIQTDPPQNQHNQGQQNIGTSVDGQGSGPNMPHLGGFGGGPGPIRPLFDRHPGPSNFRQQRGRGRGFGPRNGRDQQSSTRQFRPSEKLLEGLRPQDKWAPEQSDDTDTKKATEEKIKSNKFNRYKYTDDDDDDDEEDDLSSNSSDSDDDTVDHCRSSTVGLSENVPDIDDNDITPNHEHEHSDCENDLPSETVINDARTDDAVSKDEGQECCEENERQVVSGNNKSPMKDITDEAPAHDVTKSWCRLSQASLLRPEEDFSTSLQEELPASSAKSSSEEDSKDADISIPQNSTSADPRTSPPVDEDDEVRPRQRYSRVGRFTSPLRLSTASRRHRSMSRSLSPPPMIRKRSPSMSISPSSSSASSPTHRHSSTVRQRSLSKLPHDLQSTSPPAQKKLHHDEESESSEAESKVGEKRIEAPATSDRIHGFTTSDSISSDDEDGTRVACTISMQHDKHSPSLDRMPLAKHTKKQNSPLFDDQSPAGDRKYSLTGTDKNLARRKSHGEKWSDSDADILRKSPFKNEQYKRESHTYRQSSGAGLPRNNKSHKLDVTRHHRRSLSSNNDHVNESGHRRRESLSVSPLAHTNIHSSGKRSDQQESLVKEQSPDLQSSVSDSDTADSCDLLPTNVNDFDDEDDEATRIDSGRKERRFIERQDIDENAHRQRDIQANVTQQYQRDRRHGDEKRRNSYRYQQHNRAIRRQQQSDVNSKAYNQNGYIRPLIAGFTSLGSSDGYSSSHRQRRRGREATGARGGDAMEQEKYDGRYQERKESRNASRDRVRDRSRSRSPLVKSVLSVVARPSDSLLNSEASSPQNYQRASSTSLKTNKAKTKRSTKYFNREQSLQEQVHHGVNKDTSPREIPLKRQDTQSAKETVTDKVLKKSRGAVKTVLSICDDPVSPKLEVSRQPTTGTKSIPLTRNTAASKQTQSKSQSIRLATAESPKLDNKQNVPTHLSPAMRKDAAARMNRRSPEDGGRFGLVSKKKAQVDSLVPEHSTNNEDVLREKPRAPVHQRLGQAISSAPTERSGRLVTANADNRDLRSRLSQRVDPPDEYEDIEPMDGSFSNTGGSERKRYRRRRDV